MKTSHKSIAALLLWCVTLAVHAQLTDFPLVEGEYEANWESLAKWECPDWFRDAKFGIWAHWGPQCQAEDGDWYARNMYFSGTSQYNDHVNRYGSPADYGLKELCRDWKAANWNPDELIEFYKSVGAQYFMTLANHHDNFDLWDSPYQEWNSVNLGPEKDIVGGWAEACKKYGLPLGVSIHASHAWTWLEGSQSFDGNLTKEDGTGKWWEGYDPQELYAQRHEHSKNWNNPDYLTYNASTNGQWNWLNDASLPTEAYKMKFQNRVLQCIDKYNPDMIYFDDNVLPFYASDETIGLNILSSYYNRSAAQNGGTPNVVVTSKYLNETHKKAEMWDVERGIPPTCQPLPWQTCTCIGSWHYDRNLYNNNWYKSAGLVVRMLVDIVSKNGNLLLSVPVRADGTIDEKERAILNNIKAWMDINKESLIGTRPWKTFGEGPLAENVNASWEWNEGQSYSSSDVRYVQKDGKVYATIMAWPTYNVFRMKAFLITSDTYGGQVTSVKLLGYGNVDFTFDGNGLTLNLPSTHPNEIAPVFEITLAENTVSSELSSLIDVLSQKKDDAKIGPNTGNYTQSGIDTLTEAINQAQATLASGTDEARQEAINTLRKAYADFETKGKVPGGNLSVIGQDITVDKLVETHNFSRSDGGTTRFGTPTYWTVENFSVPQTTGNGTKNGIDNYPGYNCLMMGLWSGEDAASTSDLSNSRLYRKVALPAGHYFFGATYNTDVQLSDDAYIFASTSLASSSEIPSNSIAYYRLNQCSSDGNYYGIEFYLDSDQEVYLGWQVDLTTGGANEEFRVVNVELLDLNVIPTIQDAKPTPLLFIDEYTTTYLGESKNFSDNGETTRFRSPQNWTVENYEISDGSNGVKKGVDSWPGYNCLQLGRWNESANNYEGIDLANSRLYQQVTLPEGTYFFGAKYQEKCNNCDENVFMFASRDLVNTADIDNVISGCRLRNAATNNFFYGFTFTLDHEETIYLGWQVNSTGDYTQFRVSEVTLRKEGSDQGVLTSTWTQETEPLPTENIGNYFFVLKDYPRNLMMVSKNGQNQGGDRKTMWYTADVDPSSNKDALWVIDTDAEYQVITSVTTPDIMYQTGGSWNYSTNDNGGGNLTWGHVKFDITDAIWTVQNGYYGGENYLGPWNEVIENNAEVALNKGGAAIGHFDLFSISRGLYVSSFEDLSSASAEHPIDLTYILNNPGAERFSEGKVFSWKNGIEWISEGNGAFDGLIGNRYFERQTSPEGNTETVASDIYQQFTDMPRGFYRLSANAVGGEGLQLYANEEAVNAPTGNFSRISVISEVKEDGMLKVGAKAFDVYDDWVKFDDVKLEYMYAEAPQTIIGMAAWNKTDGVFVQSFDNDLTVSFNEASSEVSGAEFTILDASNAVILTDGEQTYYGTLSLTDKTVSLSFDDFTLEPGKDYIVTLPAYVVGFEGLMSNEETSLTFHTPWVFDGTYYLYNEATDKKLAPNGGEVDVTDEGMPIEWVVNIQGEGTIRFTETNQYLSGRWWSEPNANDAKKFTLIPSEEPGLEGFKIRKTYPEDDPWYWLYINGTRTATNGMLNDNFSDWKYAVWQFIPVDDPTGIHSVTNANADLMKSPVIYTITGQRVSAPSHGIYIINGRKVYIK